jgi:hypothetical protein
MYGHFENGHADDFDEKTRYVCRYHNIFALLQYKYPLFEDETNHFTPFLLADFSIYHKDISLVDPSGVQVSGLMQYKSAFAFLQTFVNFWFSPSIQFRMVYDQCRSSIRISWHAVLMPKIPLGRPLHVDGISYYQLDSASGLIIEHKIEKLIINNTPVQPPYGILSLLQQEAFQMQPVGVGAGAMISHR